MKPYVDDVDFTLYVGDVREVLAQLPGRSIDCCVTSPPYWGLRDYGSSDQIGLEATPEQYVEQLVGVFREVRRLLTDDGTLWLNLGDSMRDKGVVGAPWRVAFALQADGWHLRSDIIWSKPNVMPESVTDRPTKSHEYVFLLSKSARYFFDQDAVREPFEARAQQRLTPTALQPKGIGRALAGGQNPTCQGGTDLPLRVPQVETLDGSAGEAPRGADGRRKTVHDHAVNDSHDNYSHMGTAQERWPNSGRNIRSVWEIVTQPYAGAHFAVFPEALAERCIKAGCPEEGFVLDPFMGSGTTALVARKLGRNAVGVELNPTYAELCARRLSQLSLFAGTA